MEERRTEEEEDGDDDDDGGSARATRAAIYDAYVNSGNIGDTRARVLVCRGIAEEKEQWTRSPLATRTTGGF